MAPIINVMVNYDFKFYFLIARNWFDLILVRAFGASFWWKHQFQMNRIDQVTPKKKIYSTHKFDQTEQSIHCYFWLHVQKESEKLMTVFKFESRRRRHFHRCRRSAHRINLMTMFERRHSSSHTTFGNICLRLKHCCCCYLWLFAFVRSFLLLHLFHCHLYIIFCIQPANINSETEMFSVSGCCVRAHNESTKNMLARYEMVVSVLDAVRDVIHFALIKTMWFCCFFFASLVLFWYSSFLVSVGFFVVVS